MNKTLLIFLFTLFSYNSFGQKSLADFYILSDSLFRYGNYAEALKVNIEALKFATKSNNCNQIAYANMFVSKMHYYLNDRIESLRILKMCVRMADSCQIDSMRKKVYHNIGSVFIDTKEFDSAIYYLKKSLAISLEKKDYVEISRTDAVLAFVYLDKFKNYDQAVKYTNDAVKYAYQSKDLSALAFAIGKKGMLYNYKNDYVNALHEYEEGLRIYKSLNYADGELNMLNAIIVLKSILKDTSSISSFHEYIKIRNSIFNNETAQKMADYKVQYETEKKEIENELLKQQNIANSEKIKNKNIAIGSLIIGLLLIISIVVWRINIQNLKKKNMELESINALQKERERISRDLHDNVGGQLSYALFTLKGVNSEEAIKRKETEENIEESLRSIIGNLRETIWAINDEAITVNDLADRLKLYSKNMFKNTQTKIVFSRQIESNSNLKSIVGLNLYRICQEIINNAFKYANASEIKITIHSKVKTIVTISDNGNGFDIDKVKEGYGLINMRSRASEAGIHMNLSSSINHGTTIVLNV